MTIYISKKFQAIEILKDENIPKENKIDLKNNL